MMNSGEYQIVRYQLEHRRRVAELQRGMWSPYLWLNETYLDWKHLRNPYTREPLIYLAMAGERVVGMRGFFGARWLVGSPPQPLLAPCAGDLVIAPEHRNRGLVAAIMEVALQDLAERGYDYSISLSAGSLTLLSQIATGWRGIGSLRLMEHAAASPGRLPALRALARRSRLVSGLHRRVRDFARRKKAFFLQSPRPRQFEWFDLLSDRLGHRIDDCVSIESAPRPLEMADLVARLASDGRIRHVQDEEYFGWRFQNPLSHYRFLFCRDSRLEGFLVLRASIVPWRSEVSVVALRAGRVEVRSALIGSAVKLMERGTLRIWSATLAVAEREALIAENFRPVHQGITENPRIALVRPTRNGMLSREWLVDNRRLLDMTSWDLPMICSDGS